MSDQCCQPAMTDEDELDRSSDAVLGQTASTEPACCDTGDQGGTSTNQAGSSCCGGSTAARTTSITTPVA